MLFDAVPRMRVRWKDELLVGVRQQLLGAIKPQLRHCGASQHRARTVGADDRAHGDFVTTACRSIEENQLPAGVVDVDELLPEVDRGTGTLSRIEQHTVEAGTRNRIDDLVLALSVWHERQRAVDIVQESTAHRYEKRRNLRHELGELERTDASGCQCKIDRATCG